MDTSETYIEMMGRAWPILKPDMSIATLIFSRRLRMLYILDGKIVMWREEVNTNNCDRAFPLLEQDQLQEMVDFRNKELLFFENHLWVKMGAKGEGVGYTADTMEQLWLAFVMKERWDKTWNGNDWVCPG